MRYPCRNFGPNNAKTAWPISAIPEAHNPSSSVSGTLCHFLYHVVKNPTARTAVFSQLAIECVQHHICNHAINCSSVKNDPQGSQLVSLLSIVLVYICKVFYGKVSEVKIQELKP